MSIFGTIMDKIFHHPAAAAAAPAPVGDAVTADATPPAPVAGSAAPPSVTGGAAPASVDVGAVLSSMAAAKGGGGNYETSIVDLLKLLDMDSSLDARKTLGTELNVHAGADGSAEQNVALHKAVVAKLAENGGKMPASMHA